MSQEASANPTAPQLSESTGDALGALSDLERSLQGLKRLYEERRELEAKLVEAQTRLMGRETELSQRDEELARARAAADERARELETALQKLRQQQEALDRAAADTQARQAEAESQRRALEEAARAREAESEKSKTIAAELDAFAGELAQLQADLEKEKTEIESGRAALVSAAEQIKQREQELASQESGIAGALSARDAEITRRQAELDRRIAEQANAQSRADTETAGRLAAEIEAGEQARRDLEAIARRCAAQEEVLAEYEQLLAVERSHVHRLTESIQQTGAKPEQIQADVAELKECLANEKAARAKEQKRAADLAAALEKARSAGPSKSASGLRRARLKRCRAILRDQVTKVRRASEVLSKRFEQCEQVLSQRAQLAATKRQLDTAAAAVARRAAGSRAGALTLYTVLTLAILGALSWAVVNQVLPGTFAARVEIAADGRGRDLSDAEFDEWKRSLEATLAEPQFVDAVADRMKHRSYESLGTPGAVRALLTSSFAHESPSPGTIVLELRAPGADRAARALDIIATALASDANAARERRADGAVTLIKAPAAAGARPIDDQRLLYSGILMASSGVLTLGLGALLWGRLSKAKQDFELGSQIDHVLDEAKWAEFTAATTTQRQPHE